MASVSLDGSPTPHKMKESLAPNFFVFHDNDVENTGAHGQNGSVCFDKHRLGSINNDAS